MTTTKSMKRGDLLPVLEVRLAYAEGDLSAAIPPGTPVRLTMKGRGDSAPKIDKAPASIVSSANGEVVVRYEWALGDTDNTGTYQVEVEFTVGGKTLTAPSAGYLTVRIEDDLD